MQTRAAVKAPLGMSTCYVRAFHLSPVSPTSYSALWIGCSGWGPRYLGPRYATKENRMKFQLSPPSVSQEFSLVVKLYSPTLCALWLGVWLCKPPFSLTHNPPLAVSLGGATRKRKDAKEEGSSSVDSIASHLAAVIGFYSQVVFFCFVFSFFSHCIQLSSSHAFC